MFAMFNDQPQNVKQKSILFISLLVLINLLVWLWAWASFSHSPALLSTALLAYLFGLRHAFDADHIAAIDNVVRKLMQENKKPLSVGFFFSLGHSTIVVLAAIAVALATSVMKEEIPNIGNIGGVIGTLVSGFFLLAIGIANFLVLRGLWQTFRKAHKGQIVKEADIEDMLNNRGLIARILRPLLKRVSRSWHMYPIGFLFGMGFDTATEIGLLGISASQASQGLGFAEIMVFPALFTAGMSLMDSTDSMMMTGAYGWAFVKPLRKLWFNLTLTAASVVIALFIGGMEVLGLLSEKLNLTGGAWAVVNNINDSLENFGFIVVGFFILSWLISAIIYKRNGYDNILIE